MRTITDIAITSAAFIGLMLALFLAIGAVALVIAAIEEITHPIKSACKRYKSGGYRP